MKQARPEFAEFSERLRQAREHAGFAGVREAARNFGWNENTYKSRESALRGIPEYADVKKYARAFRVPWIWLLTGEGDGPSWANLRSQESKFDGRNASAQRSRPRLYSNQPRDSDRIQVEIGTLRKRVAGFLLQEGFPHEQALAYADGVIGSLLEHPGELSALYQVVSDRTPPVSPGPANGGPSHR